MTITTLFSFFVIVLFCLLPIVFWGYIFSYIDSKLANRKRFSFGIIAGIVSTLPVLYFGKNSGEGFGKSFDFPHILSSFGDGNGSVSGLLLGCFIVIFLVSVSGFFFSLFQRKLFETLALYIKNIFFFLLGTICITVLFWFIGNFFRLFPSTNINVSDGIQYGNYFFESLKVIIFYYLVIGLIEESSKHFHFLSGTLPSIKNTKEIVLLSVFVALGFSFTENIIYIWKIYGQIGLGGDIVRTYVFRSCFSLMLHVVCSAFLSHMFSLVWYRKRLFSLFSLTFFLFGIIGSILLHSLFDISLTLSWSFIPFLYFGCGYLYVSSIFYKDLPLNSTELEI